MAIKNSKRFSEVEYCLQHYFNAQLSPIMRNVQNDLNKKQIKEYFYECMPSMTNPLGLGHKSIPLISKVQNLLIGDFLNYLALRHQIFLSSMTSLEKKKLKPKPLPKELL